MLTDTFTESLARGASYLVPLRYRTVLSIDEVSLGATVFIPEVDYTLDGNNLEWIPAGNIPGESDVCDISYTHYLYDIHAVTCTVVEADYVYFMGTFYRDVRSVRDYTNIMKYKYGYMKCPRIGNYSLSVARYDNSVKLWLPDAIPITDTTSEWDVLAVEPLEADSNYIYEFSTVLRENVMERDYTNICKHRFVYTVIPIDTPSFEKVKYNSGSELWEPV